MPAIVAASLLSADFAALGQDIAAVERGGAGLLHVDVMDGHFVPNLSMGPPVVSAIRRVAHVPLDVHLMLDDPDPFVRPFVDAGGLLSYGADLSHMYRRSAVFVSKILQGTKPADLPIEQPTKFELVINLKTAKAIGIDLPLFLQQRADEVIE